MVLLIVQCDIPANNIVILQVARECVNIGNFNSMMGIISGNQYIRERERTENDSSSQTLKTGSVIGLTN